MLERRASFTAAFVAASRGLSPLLPARMLLVDDPVGAHLAHPLAGAIVDGLSSLPEPLRGAAWGPLALMLPWAVFMQVRTRAIDDALREAIEGGCPQVVILGAGLDARAVRLAALLGDARVYEVDHPATQAYKREALARVGARSAARYVAWNFERDRLDALADTLAALGHDRARPTFTVWEGVTMYLTRPAIEATLAAVRAYSAVGSAVAINYVDRALVERPSLLRRAVSGLVRRVGEPFITGFDRGEMAALLADVDFSVARDDTFGAWATDLYGARWAHRVGEGGNLVIARKTR